jgi:GT2 family glycosyltransferase
MLIEPTSPAGLAANVSVDPKSQSEANKQELTLDLVIVTYQREQELLNNLTALVQFKHLFHELLIVDNGNSADLPSKIGALFPNMARVIQPQENLGAVARSLGILASSADIVLTLDDDVKLLDPMQLLLLKQLFMAHPALGCANFRIVYADSLKLDVSDWCHPREPRIYQHTLFDTAYISEGACALHGETVRRLGAYPLDLWIGQEGVELAARLYDAGKDIIYFPAVTVAHSVAMQGRSPGRQFFYNTRNIYWIVLRTYPWRLALYTLAREWATLAIFALIRGRMDFFIQGSKSGVKQTFKLLRARKPISTVAANRLRNANRLKPSVFARLKRVLMSRTLD